MSRIWAWLLLALFATPFRVCQAQTAIPDSLPELKYPPIARAAHVQGDVVVLLIEVKAQIGSAKRDDWVRDRLGNAVSQLEKSKALLQAGKVPKLRNDFYGELDFVPQNYPNVFGIVVLAHDSASYYAPDLVPELLASTFPIHVFSLKDFTLVADRFVRFQCNRRTRGWRAKALSKVRISSAPEANDISAMR